MAGEDGIDYPAFLRRALRGMLRDLLRRVAERGVPAGHELFITLRTTDSRVDLPDLVRGQHPEEITIVLRPRFFDGLTLDEQGFQVTLQFGSLPARIAAPFAAVLRFADPAASFGLDLGPADEPAPPPEPPPPAAGGESDGGNRKVVSFGSRAKRKM